MFANECQMLPWSSAVSFNRLDMGLKQLIDLNGGAMTAAFTEKELRKITLFFGQVVAAKANGKERTEMFEDQL